MGKRVKGFHKDKLPASDGGRLLCDRMDVCFTSSELDLIQGLFSYQSMGLVFDKLVNAGVVSRLSSCLSCAVLAMGNSCPTGSFPWDVLNADEANILKAVQNAGVRGWTEKVYKLLCIPERRFLFDSLSETFRQLHGDNNKEK